MNTATKQTQRTFESEGLACAPKPATDWRPEWMRQGLAEALQRYWGAAYAEGKEDRDYDTEDGVAGLALYCAARIRGGPNAPVTG